MVLALHCLIRNTITTQRPEFLRNFCITNLVCSQFLTYFSSFENKKNKKFSPHSPCFLSFIIIEVLYSASLPFFMVIFLSFFHLSFLPFSRTGFFFLYCIFFLLVSERRSYIVCASSILSSCLSM